MDFDLNIIMVWVVTTIVIKSVLVGSSFSIYNWICYGKEYTDWYDNICQQRFVPKGKNNH